MTKAADKLALARKHLAKVQVAWATPEWAELSMFGLYSLEAAVDAAAAHFAVPAKAAHASRVDAARVLAEKHGLPDIADLLRELNEVRKGEAYGDVEEPPELNAEEVAIEVEAFVDAVAKAVAGGADE